jgi:hypothetical protein
VQIWRQESRALKDILGHHFWNKEGHTDPGTVYSPHTHSLSLSHSLSLTLSLSHTHTHSPSHTHSLSLTHSVTHSVTHSHTHTLSLSLSHSLTHPLTHSLVLLHTSWHHFRNKQSHTDPSTVYSLHTQTHMLSLSPPPSPPSLSRTQKHVLTPLYAVKGVLHYPFHSLDTTLRMQTGNMSRNWRQRMLREKRNLAQKWWRRGRNLVFHTNPHSALSWAVCFVPIIQVQIYLGTYTCVCCCNSQKSCFYCYLACLFGHTHTHTPIQTHTHS